MRFLIMPRKRASCETHPMGDAMGQFFAAAKAAIAKHIVSLLLLPVAAIIVAAIFYFVFGSSESTSEIHPVIGHENSSRKVDVVLVHGVDGDAFSTWTSPNDPKAFWPRWLGEQNADFGVWTFGYPAATTVFTGEAMGLVDRGNNLLTVLEANGFADDEDRPLVFVVHSFGGLVVKQALRTAADSKEESWQKIRRRTKGIFFISTPHSGSQLASFVKHVGGRLARDTVRDLEYAESSLIDLNHWYRDNSLELGVQTQSVCETRKTAGVMIVDKVVGDPAIPGARVRMLDGDHISICKLKSDQDTLFKQTNSFIKGLLRRPPPLDCPPGANDVAAGGCNDPPSADEVQAPPKERPEDVVLFYENKTGEVITIVLFDWSRHYGKINGPCRILDTPADDEQMEYQSFTADSTGWFSVYVYQPNGKYSPCLGTANLFASRKPRIVITRDGHDYVAEIK